MVFIRWEHRPVYHTSTWCSCSVRRCIVQTQTIRVWYEPYEYNNELDTCTEEAKARARESMVEREREWARGSIVYAFALYMHHCTYTDREIPSSSVRNRIWTARRRTDDMARWFVHFYVHINFTLCARPKWIKCYRLCVCKCWRLCNGFTSQLSLSANSFSYGFLYTQFPVSIHTNSRHTFTGMTATRRTVSSSTPSNQNATLHLAPSLRTTENLVSLLHVSLCTVFRYCAPHCRFVRKCAIHYDISICRYIGRLCSMVIASKVYTSMRCGAAVAATAYSQPLPGILYMQRKFYFR